MYMSGAVGSSPIRGSSFFQGKVTTLGVLCCFALFVCLFDLACFFLSFFLLISHLKTYNYYVLVLMRDEKEGRKKQARTNKQQSKE